MFLVNNMILMAIEMYRNALIHEKLREDGNIKFSPSVPLLYNWSMGTLNIIYDNIFIFYETLTPERVHTSSHTTVNWLRITYAIIRIGDNAGGSKDIEEVKFP
jgi:hypothetical protein